ncbi:MAG TPA: tetratricopeptide repeat protein [Smithella sp.]|nr:tetratricopeptide repeat protein [Smithella sp.]
MSKKYTGLIIALLTLACCVTFGRIAGNEFICFDDGRYIIGNQHVQSGFNPENVRWTLTAVVSGNWHPLTMLSHMLDWALFGAHPAGHHIVSLIFHIGAVVFLFLFLKKTTGNPWTSGFAAAIFALHPLRVESVAWAAERKDVLSMFFGMACLYAYAFYAENSKPSRYMLCLILFALSLMSKPMLVTLPFVLLLIDYWPLGRWQSAPFANRSLIREKIPFIILSIISIILTLWAQNKGGLVIPMENIPFSVRALNAIISYVAYLGKFFWPSNLAIHYPYEFPFPLWQLLLSLLILTGISVTVIYQIKKMPFLFVGWYWYLGTLIPVLGLIQVASQAMADRYTYLPSIGIAVMLSWGVKFFLVKNESRKKVLVPSAIAVLFILSIITWKQCGYWKNSITLFQHALQVTNDNYMAHGGLAIALLNENKPLEAIEHLNQALRIKPLYQFYRMRAIAHESLGHDQQSIEDYSSAIRLKPYHAEDYFNRGLAYVNLRQYQPALEDFNQAIQLKQDHADAYNNRGYIYLVQGQKQPGCADAQTACAMGNCKTLKWATDQNYCH